MAVKIQWTDRAKAHLRDLLDYLAFENRDAAQALARKIFQSVDRLAEFPYSGRSLPELEDAPFRERIIPPCRVIYLLRESDLLIVAVLRTERKLLPELLED